MHLIKSVRISADIDGTFTDIVALAADNSVRTIKVLANPPLFTQ